MRWSIAETVLNYQRVSGRGWLIAGSYVLLSGGAKLLATGRSDSDDGDSIAGAAAKAALIENLIELSAETLRGRYLLQGGSAEELSKTLPILQASQQGEILTHLFYPLMVANTLPSALISTTATGALLHHMYSGVLSRYADTFMLFEPTGEDILATFKPEFVRYFEREVAHQPIDEWARSVAESIGTGQLRGKLRETLLKFNVMSDVFMHERAVMFSFLLPYYSLFPGVRWQAIDELALQALRSVAGFDDELIERLMGLSDQVIWYLLGSEPREMSMLVGMVSQRLDRNLAERFERASTRLALLKLASESTLKTTLLSLAAWATSSVLPMVLDKLFGWTHLANPVHHAISAGMEHIRGRKRRREEHEREEKLRQEGWYGRHVGVGEHSVGTAATIEAHGLPFEHHSRYDPVANLLFSERWFGALAGGSRTLTEGWVRSVLDLPSAGRVSGRWELLRHAARLYGTELEGIRARLSQEFRDLRAALSDLLSRAVVEPRRGSAGSPYRSRTVPGDAAPGDLLPRPQRAPAAPHRPPRLTVRYRSVSSSRYELERLVAKKLGLDRVYVSR